MKIRNIIENEYTANIISIVWGLGLATIFRHSCKTRNCIIIQGPDPNEIKDNNYKFNDKCYKYDAYAVSCDSK
jgi:hypothetical protein